MTDNKDKIIPFPTDRIVDVTHIGPTIKTDQSNKIKEKHTKDFIETAVDDLSMNLLRSFVDLAMRTNSETFTRDLALLIDVLRGMISRDFDIKHPSQDLADKMITLKVDRNGQQIANIDYSKVLEIKAKSKPLSKDVSSELKDLQDGAGVFFEPDGELDE